MEYVLVIRKDNGLKIGRNVYDKPGVMKRLEEVQAAGINCMEIMKYDVAKGVQG